MSLSVVRKLLEGIDFARIKADEKTPMIATCRQAVSWIVVHTNFNRREFLARELVRAVTVCFLLVVFVYY